VCLGIICLSLAVLCKHTILVCTPLRGLGPYALVGGAYVLPHPEKMGKGGEDWFFVSDTMRALGVADGVGGWVSELCAEDSGASKHGGRALWIFNICTICELLMLAAAPSRQQGDLDPSFFCQEVNAALPVMSVWCYSSTLPSYTHTHIHTYTHTHPRIAG